MNQQPLLLSFLAALALLSITGYAEKTQDAKTLEQRVDELELEVQVMRATLAGVSETSSAEAGELDAIKAFLQKQSKSAKQMVETLAEAESMGFVAGINHGSRSTLLSGWRKQLAAQQAGVPGARSELKKDTPRGKP